MLSMFGCESTQHELLATAPGIAPSSDAAERISSQLTPLFGNVVKGLAMEVLTIRGTDCQHDLD